MASYSLYIDDGGWPGVKTIICAAYLARVEEWERLTKKWSALLKRNGISHIHMVKMSDFTFRPYAHLDRDARLLLLYRAADIITSHVKFGIVSAISEIEFDRIAENEGNRSRGSAYSLIVNMILMETIKRLGNFKTTDGGNVLNIYIEDGHRNIRGVIEELRGIKEEMNPIDLGSYSQDECVISTSFRHCFPIRIGEIGTGSKDGPTALIPLQTADILAYSFARRGRKRIPKDDLADLTLERIERRIEHRSQLWSGESLALVFQKIREGQQIDEQAKLTAHHFWKMLRKSGLDVQKTEHGYSFEIPENWRSELEGQE